MFLSKVPVVIFISVIMAHQNEIDNLCEDNTDKPHYCVHNKMCYGHDQYCSKSEDKIQDCLPVEDPLEWCRRNMNNLRAMPNPQCARACFAKFNISELNPTPENATSPISPGEGDSWFKTLLVISSVLFIALIIVTVLAFRFCKQNKKLQQRINKLQDHSSEKLLGPNGDGEPCMSVNRKAERQISEEETSVMTIVKPIQTDVSGNGGQREIVLDLESNEGNMTGGSSHPSPVHNSSSDTGYESSNQPGPCTNCGYGNEATQQESTIPHGQSSSATQIGMQTVSRGIPTVMPQTGETDGRGETDRMVTSQSCYSTPEHE